MIHGMYNTKHTSVFNYYRAPSCITTTMICDQDHKLPQLLSSTDY